MLECIILIAEDDEEAIGSWNRDIREFNRDVNRSINYHPVFAKSKRAAINELNRTRINCAVVDLRLPEADGNPDGHNTEPIGNEVLERLLLEVGIPAVVYSGYTQEASELVQHSRVQIINKKGGGAMEALRWLAGHESLMSAMEVTRKRIAHECARLFNQAIWPRWEQTWNLMQDHDALAGMITRQIVSHVAEQLSMPSNFHHPEEFYLVPPLNDRLSTGDLVKVDGNVYIIVTPRCNIARDTYPNHLMLAFCKSMEDVWGSMRDRFNSGNEKKKASAAKDLHTYASQGHSTSTHFLPPCGENGPWLVDFREIMTVPSSRAATLLDTRFASVAVQFVPNLVQRYAAYLGRIGQPDLDCDVLREKICT